jgi:hypothetical protein
VRSLVKSLIRYPAQRERESVRTFRRILGYETLGFELRDGLENACEHLDIIRSCRSRHKISARRLLPTPFAESI